MRLVIRAVLILVLAVAAAGCDKCGNRINFNAPSLPNACGANADRDSRS